MAKRIQGKNIRHTKHSPVQKLQNETEFNSTILIKSSTPFISALKRIQKQLNKFSKSAATSTSSKKYQNDQYKKLQYIKVRGMGKCLEKTLKLALKFQELNYRVDIVTGSIEVIDEFEKLENEDEEEDEEEEKMDVDVDVDVGKETMQEDDVFDDEERIYRKRMVSTVEVRIWLNRD
ncbi:hypothetical protein PVL30_003988 [Lodderomyces elongisporus]|uniref:uncharacterized protein n=1 Tax=Lodderomyces elongisporus TaxID=36914 RepID=UPI00291F6227|nr:uncharacterized protein PVL30_003988 [Lodderomyces elongisporus]WLF80212.1 hypothetical protein PVL30_003988 [Lodderomyces elongisporus]